MAAGMSSDPPGSDAGGERLAEQAAWADAGSATAIHDHAKASRIAGQHDVACAGEDGWDAREPGAVSRGFQRGQHAEVTAGGGQRLDRDQGEAGAVPAFPVERPRLDRRQQRRQPVRPVGKPRPCFGSRISASWSAGTNSKKRSPGYSARWSASV